MTEHQTITSLRFTDSGLHDSDPFSPEALRVTPDLGATDVRRVLTTVPVRKPGRQEFIRVHQSPDYRLDTGLVELKDDREYYLVHPAMRPELAEEIVFVRLHFAVSRGGAVFLWPIRLPGADGRRNAWHESAARAAELAMREWTRVSANQAAGGYDTFTASAALAEPDWPALSMAELLRLAFRERLIDSADHPVVRRLRGLA